MALRLGADSSGASAFPLIFQVREIQWTHDTFAWHLVRIRSTDSDRTSLGIVGHLNGRRSLPFLAERNRSRVC